MMLKDVESTVPEKPLVLHTARARHLKQMSGVTPSSGLSWMFFASFLSQDLKRSRETAILCASLMKVGLKLSLYMRSCAEWKAGETKRRNRWWVPLHSVHGTFQSLDIFGFLDAGTDSFRQASVASRYRLLAARASWATQDPGARSINDQSTWSTCIIWYHYVKLCHIHPLSMIVIYSIIQCTGIATIYIMIHNALHSMYIQSDYSAVRRRACDRPA